jgi:hypothetical protein
MLSIQRETVMADKVDKNPPDLGVRVLEPEEALTLAKIQQELAVASIQAPLVRIVEGSTPPCQGEGVSQASPAAYLAH